MTPVVASVRESRSTACTSAYHQLVQWLTAKVADCVGVPPETIEVDTPLADCGIDSVAALALCLDLQDEKGFDVETTLVWDYPTISAIAGYLIGDRKTA